MLSHTKRTSEVSGFSADDYSGCLTPWDVQSRRIFIGDCAWPTLYGGEGGGKGYVMVPNPNYMLKVRCGKDTYIKPDGTTGTAGKGALISEDVTFTIAASQDQTLFQPANFRVGSDDSLNYIVRRLTPLETERLQGMPDNHTDLTGCDVDAVTEKVAASLGYSEEQKEKLRRKIARWSKDCPDGPRYKAVGNAFAVPVVRWIGERIQAVDEIINKSGEEE